MILLHDITFNTACVFVCLITFNTLDAYKSTWEEVCTTCI